MFISYIFYCPHSVQMKKISIIPDTNVLLSNLGFFINIIDIESDFIMAICISRTVLHEMDSLKENKKARKAIAFLSNKQEHSRLEFEGYDKSDQIEVDFEPKKPIKPNNNDEEILNYALSLENPIIISNDNNFNLKCKSHNTTCINVNQMGEIGTFNIILKSAESKVSSNPMEEIIEQVERIRVELFKIVKETLIKELGELQSKLFLKNDDIKSLLLMITKEFSMFKSHFPSSSQSLFKKFYHKIDQENIEGIKEMLPCMLTLLGMKIKK